ncbi:uncharacterized protein LOC117335333 [Pecten maximus]|uniref:uncharacterized protein LOC117335333 n=1 Tax=Pecten maximus TaxID=6579 RepID=UPI00145900E0|nr:uncharacterized protein LOC117335333 [Pecten maximus]
MYRTIMAFRLELFQFSTLLMLLMVGFSSFIYLMYGHMEGSFKTVMSGILTLFRMTIGMIKFRNDLELDVLGITIILSLYALAVTMVYINMFTSALNFGITNIKRMIAEGETSFEIHLNQHIWDRLANVLSLCRPSRTVIHTETSEGTEQTEPRKEKLNLRQGEVSVERFLSKLSEQVTCDVQQEKDFFKKALLPSRHFAGQNFIWSCRRETTHGVQYRYSNDWMKGDNSLVLEFPDKKVDCRIDVECIPENVAIQRGLIPYGQSTHPISPLFIVNTKYYSIKSCKVMVKVQSSKLSTKSVFLIIGTGDPFSWEQYTTQHIAADERNVYLSVSVPRCPRYIIAVRSDLWCDIPDEIQQKHINTFVVTSKKAIIQPGSTKNMLLSFPKNSVTSDTVIKTVMEQGDPFPTLHVLASGKVSGPIFVEYVGKRRTDWLSLESFMELQILTKTGDLEWKKESTRTERHDNVVELKSLEAGVKAAITVSLSDYKTLFADASNQHLERGRKTLMNIYKGLIPAKHWRQIGKYIGVSEQQLARLENMKPRSLEEKTCLVLGHWLKKNNGRDLGEIKHIWEVRKDTIKV